ncbi:hypothetical protein [Rhodococcus spongiicola]|uniref:Uncharacterized protein n=1 Tax=Rhodococcus spongiicola TaxID=2487352 RepID=A0A438B5E2_9NOCA|nr:hypothetical protein [Rhodococcus spongiicola]RVW06213.1 hypothetical protein EF834_01795 [Rhodococcus spongiicola]
MPMQYGSTEVGQVFFGATEIEEVWVHDASLGWVDLSPGGRITAQGLLKDGTQQLGSETWQKVLGWRLDPAFPDTDPTSPSTSGLVIPGHASFMVTGIATTTNSNVTESNRDARIVDGASAEAFTLQGLVRREGATTEVAAIIPGGTDQRIAMQAYISSSLSSSRVLAADMTKLSYRLGSYYESQEDVEVTTSGDAPVNVAPINSLAQWPTAAGSGILLPAGTYQVTWGVLWPFQSRGRFPVGANENEVYLHYIGDSDYGISTQTVSVPSETYVLPTLRADTFPMRVQAGEMFLLISKLA